MAVVREAEMDLLWETEKKLLSAMGQSKKILTEHKGMGLKDYLDSTNASGQRQIRADVISEEVFYDALIKQGLNGILYSEESGVKPFGNPYADDSLNILLDPLDGSNNYQNGVPIGCISVAYGLKRGHKHPSLADLVGGIVLDLYNNEYFSAIKGVGVWKNGRKFKLPICPYPPTYKINVYAYDQRIKTFFKDFRGQYTFKSLGSVAWELIMTVKQEIDLFVDLRGRVKVHDFAAAKIILEEAGCVFQLFEPVNEAEVPLSDFESGYRILASCDLDLIESVASDLHFLDTRIQARRILSR